MPARLKLILHTARALEYTVNMCLSIYGVPSDKSAGASYPKDGSGISGGTSSAGKSTTHCPSGLPYKHRFSASEISEYLCKNKLGYHGKHPFDASVCSQLKVG
jgi:hypothetical protein